MPSIGPGECLIINSSRRNSSMRKNRTRRFENRGLASPSRCEVAACVHATRMVLSME